MPTGKNFISFILAFLIALTFIIYAFFVTAGNADAISEYLSYNGEEFIIFGSRYRPDPRIENFLSTYLSVCQSTFDLAVPDIISDPAKKAAAAVAEAGEGVISGIRGIFSHLIHGNM